MLYLESLYVRLHSHQCNALKCNAVFHSVIVLLAVFYMGILSISTMLTRVRVHASD
jgi:hypothetical protein